LNNKKIFHRRGAKAAEKKQKDILLFKTQPTTPSYSHTKPQRTQRKNIIVVKKPSTQHPIIFTQRHRGQRDFKSLACGSVGPFFNQLTHSLITLNNAEIIL